MCADRPPQVYVHLKSHMFLIFLIQVKDKDCVIDMNFRKTKQKKELSFSYIHCSIAFCLIHQFEYLMIYTI